MNASRFISRKLAFKGRMAAIAVAISFLVVIIAMAVSSGFRKELRLGLSALSGDIRISPPDLDISSEDNPVSFGDVREIVSGYELVPVIYRAGIVKSGTDIQGVLVKGLPGGGDSLGVSIPSHLASMLGIGPGDDLPTYFIGDRVKVRRFKVRSVYAGVMTGSGSQLVLAGLEDMRRLNSWDSDEVSAVEVRLPASLAGAGEEVAADMTYALARDWPGDGDSPVAVSSRTLYSRIFSWLDLIDFNVLIILLLMIVVAGFNMISGLLIMLFRNIRTIGTLKSMGMTDRGISAVFLRVASRIVLLGMAAGNAAALLFCLVQDKTHMIKLNPENYFVSWVPVNVNLLQLLSVNAAAYLAIMLLLLLTSLFVAGIDPAKTVRAQ